MQLLLIPGSLDTLLIPSHAVAPPVQQPMRPAGGMVEHPTNKGAVPRGVNLAAVLPHGEVVCALALSHPFQHVFTGGRVSADSYQGIGCCQNMGCIWNARDSQRSQCGFTRLFGKSSSINA
jgi:hypothetical protein